MFKGLDNKIFLRLQMEMKEENIIHEVSSIK